MLALLPMIDIIYYVQKGRVERPCLVLSFLSIGLEANGECIFRLTAVD